LVVSRDFYNKDWKNCLIEEKDLISKMRREICLNNRAMFDLYITAIETSVEINDIESN
jgi:hypothetical protein